MQLRHPSFSRISKLSGRAFSVSLSATALCFVLGTTGLTVAPASALSLKGGVSFYRAEDYQHALPYFQNFVRLYPNNEQGRYYLALCYQKQNLTTQANEQFLWLKQHARNARIRAYVDTVLKNVTIVPPQAEPTKIPPPNSEYAAGAVSTAETMYSASVPTAEKVPPALPPATIPPGTPDSPYDKGAGNHQELCKVIYFYKPDDEACATFDKEFAKVESELKGRLSFEKMNLNDPAHRSIVSRYGVKTVPTLVYLDGNGKVLLSDGSRTFSAEANKLALKR